MKLSANILLVLFGLGMFSCDKDSNDPQYPTMEEYMDTNKIEDFEETASGLRYVIEKEGTGDLPKTGQTVTVHYTGYHLDDTKFDSSYDRNKAYTVLLGQGLVIAGWEEGLRYFNEGAAGVLYIPYELAYGPSGYASIGPMEDLKFEISIVAID